MCLSDDGLMHISPKSDSAHHGVGHSGDGEVLECRDYNKLLAWARAPEQTACYSQLSDYTEVRHSLEQYSVCPEDSPYRALNSPR